MNTGGHWSYVINLANSVIGVSILAMPYCIKQCGILLGTLLILSSAYLTKVSCSLLLKSSKSSKTASYEYLAYYVFGAAGKFAVEVCIIGLMMGTCVAFYVIIGDLAPITVAGWFGLENTWLLRTVVLVFVACFIALPLGLMKKIESITNISTLSIGFYIFFTIYIFVKSISKFRSGLWIDTLDLIKFEGLFYCLPILSLAFACQTQLFVVYDALSDRTERKMMDISKDALNIVSSIYIMVGIFGYITYMQDGIKGDILLNFQATFIADLLKVGFAISVALSFPMMIFPCRKSINTLFFGQQSLENAAIGGADYIPPTRFSLITISIISITLLVSICIPSVETVLSVTGATMGCLIAYIFPSLMFIMNVQKGPGRGSAQTILFIGLLILFASTYTSLNPRSKDIINEKKINKEKPLLEDSQQKIDIENEEFIDKLQKSEKKGEPLQKDLDINKKILSGEENSKQKVYNDKNEKNPNNLKLLEDKDENLNEKHVIAELIHKQEKQEEILKQQNEEINKLKKQQDSLEQAANEINVVNENNDEVNKNNVKMDIMERDNVDKEKDNRVPVDGMLQQPDVDAHVDGILQQPNAIIKPIEKNIKIDPEKNSPEKPVLKQDLRDSEKNVKGFAQNEKDIKYPLQVENFQNDNNVNRKVDHRKSDDNNHNKVNTNSRSNEKLNDKIGNIDDVKADGQVPLNFHGIEKINPEIDNKVDVN